MNLVRAKPLVALVAVGVAVRVVLAAAFVGLEVDIDAWRAVARQVDADVLWLYDLNPEGGGLGSIWPYSPLFAFPIALSDQLAALTGVPFHATVQLWTIAADVAIAIAIYVYLGWRGPGEGAQLAGAALVMLGPCFIAVSGYHGQFDQVAILPAVLAVMVWERGPQEGRATHSGLLAGLGAALKTVPGLIVLPLLAAARSLTAGVRLVVAAVAVPALVLVPFLIADPAGVLELRNYQGLPGLGGLSLASDPSHAEAWVTGSRPTAHDRGAIGSFVSDNAGAITGLALAALTAFLFRFRPAPIHGAVLLWLTIYAASPNFFMNYLVWGLPFFIMAGHLRAVAIGQLALVPAMVIYYLFPLSEATPAYPVYATSMLGLWGFWVVALIVVARRIVRGYRPGPAPARALPERA